MKQKKKGKRAGRMKNIIFVENFREVTKLSGSLLCNVILHGTQRKKPKLLTQNFIWVKGYVLLKLKLLRGRKQKEYHEIYFVPAFFFVFLFLHTT